MVKMIAFAYIAVKNMADIMPLCPDYFFVIFDSAHQHTDFKKKKKEKQSTIRTSNLLMELVLYWPFVFAKE